MININSRYDLLSDVTEVALLKIAIYALSGSIADHPCIKCESIDLRKIMISELEVQLDTAIRFTATTSKKTIDQVNVLSTRRMENLLREPNKFVLP